LAKTLYEILGVEEKATGDEIRAAYRKLAKQHHPDLNPGDKAAEEQFKKISAAFSILRDDEQRARYDRGEIDESGAEKPESRFYRQYADSDSKHHYHSSAGYEDFVDLGDMFAEAFARRQHDQPHTREYSFAFPGGDLRYHLAIEFMEAVKGLKKRISMPDGVTLDVSIPAGITDGQVLRLKNKGLPGVNGGPPGDALVSITIKPHPVFQRQGNDIILELPIGLHEAVLGSSVEVPTIDGRVNMAVPKGATTGQTLRLRGKGIERKKSRGDQLVRLKIVMPEKVDEELENFMKTWADSHRYNPRIDLEKKI